MTRIIKTSTPGKERAKLSKAIVIAIREFMRQEDADKSTKDVVSFVILALMEIAAGIDKSVAAWEKRGYWVKADKYRMEWLWAGEYAKKIKNAFENSDWETIARLFLEIMGQFENIKVSDRHKMGKPWQGAFKMFQEL